MTLAKELRLSTEPILMNDGSDVFVSINREAPQWGAPGRAIQLCAACPRPLSRFGVPPGSRLQLPLTPNLIDNVDGKVMPWIRGITI